MKPNIFTTVGICTAIVVSISTQNNNRQLDRNECIETKDYYQFNFNSLEQRGLNIGLPIVLANDQIVKEILAEARFNGIDGNMDSIKKMTYFLQNSDSFRGKPNPFFRDDVSPALYWGLGKNRHITLSFIGDKLLLSAFFPDRLIKDVSDSNIASFQRLVSDINKLLA